MDIEEWYKNNFTNKFDKYNLPSYEELITSAGIEILCDMSIGSYSRDSLLIVKRKNLFGFLTFGWGSCSGCDALKACHSFESLNKLRNTLYNSIIWKTGPELVEYLNIKDWAGEFYYYTDDESTQNIKIKTFIEEAKKQILFHYLANIQ